MRDLADRSGIHAWVVIDTAPVSAGLPRLPFEASRNVQIAKLVGSSDYCVVNRCSAGAHFACSSLTKAAACSGVIARG